MSEFEDRLRAAMASAAGPAPAGLLDAIRKRRRAHRLRVTATVAGVTAMAAIGAPLAVELAAAGFATGSGSDGGRLPHRAGAWRLRTRRAAPGSPGPRAAPGTVLRACNSAEGGTLGSNWKAQLAAGPVWFIAVKPQAGAQVSPKLRHGAVAASAMAIAVSNGHTAIITAGPGTHTRSGSLPASTRTTCRTR